MTGPKTNEGATKAGERTGTRAVARYIRVSATKAREVLDLIRGLDVSAADDVLRFAERDVAIVIRKVLASAVANAQNNDAQDPDELKVVACFADEGPTLKRFRPRARGRATRVRKRTCHITVVVGRMTERELELRRAREASHPQTGRRAGRGAAAAAAARRERVARSRQAAAAAAGSPGGTADEASDETSAADELDASTTTELDADVTEVDEAAEDVVDEDAESVDEAEDADTVDEGQDSETVDEAQDDETVEDDGEDEDAAAAPVADASPGDETDDKAADEERDA
jgi:large subunit ribosomal protein L22